MRIIGLMSGTSLDGLDIAVTSITQKEKDFDVQLEVFETHVYPEDLKTKLQALMDPAARLQDISSMNMFLGDYFGRCVVEVCKNHGILLETVDFISSHGQTIWHEPNEFDQGRNEYFAPNTLQIGDLSALAEATGRPVVGDFRPRDLAAGGQGAPLVPFVDQLLYQVEQHGRVLLNVGGIANCTILPPRYTKKKTLAYDTGPGNMVIDAFVQKLTVGEESFDAGGRRAARGDVHREWLEQLMKHPFYQQQAPKSTGREQFGDQYSTKLWEQAKQHGVGNDDGVATLTELTAVSIADEILKWKEEYSIRELFISGGGAHNQSLIERLQQKLADITIRPSDELGIPVDAKEAVIFALLGYMTWHKQPNNLPDATGADRPVILGKMVW